MGHEPLSRKLDKIVAKAPRSVKEPPPDPEAERERRRAELIEQGMQTVQELDPIVRERYRDDPASLAEWDEIMHMCDGLDEEDATKQSAPPVKKK
jgi:hypothetical protein